MKAILSFLILLVSLNSLVIASVENLGELRPLNFLAEPETWKKFEARVREEGKLVNGELRVLDLGIYLHRIMESPGVKRDIKEGKVPDLLAFVHPDKRSREAFAEFFVDYNNFARPTLPMEEIKDLVSLNEGKEGMFFPIDIEYLEKNGQLEKQQTSVPLLINTSTEVKNSEPSKPLPKEKPQELAASYVVGDMISDIPAMKRTINSLRQQISSLRQEMKESQENVVGTVGIDYGPAIFALEANMKALTEKLNNMAEVQALSPQADTSDMQREVLDGYKHLQKQFEQALKERGLTVQTPVTSSDEGVNSYIYPALVLGLGFVAILFLLIIFGAIFGYFRNKKTGGKIKVIENDIKELKKDALGINSEFESVKDRTTALEGKYKELNQRVNSHHIDLERINLRSSIQVEGLPKKMSDMQNGSKKILTVNSTLDDKLEYKLVLERINDLDVKIYGIWRDNLETTKKGEPIVVFKINTDFEKAFINAYTSGRMVGVDVGSEKVA